MHIKKVTQKLRPAKIKEENNQKIEFKNFRLMIVSDHIQGKKQKKQKQKQRS